MKTIAFFLLLLIVVVSARRGRFGNRLRCIYDKGKWSDCDTNSNTVSRVLTLKTGGNACERTQTQIISCEKHEQIQAWKIRKMERRHQKKERQEERKRCIYDFGEWSECDPENNTVTRILTLRDGEEGCETNKTIVISCERFDRMQEIKAKKIHRSEKRKGGKQQRKLRRHRMRQERLRCKYDKGNWSECDNTTNTVTRTLTLRDGEEGCEPTMEITITCDRYERIQAWKAKKMEMKNKRKAKNMLRKEKTMLKENFEIIQEQRRNGCDFEVSFSECNSTTNMVTKTYTPTSAEDESCDVTSITYSCDMHNRLMMKKMRRQNKKAGRKSMRRAMKRRIFRKNEQ